MGHLQAYSDYLEFVDIVLMNKSCCSYMNYEGLVFIFVYAIVSIKESVYLSIVDN